MVVLSNRLTGNVASDVPPALIRAGLPTPSVPAFLQGLTINNFDNVPGITLSITLAGTQAYRLAATHAFRTVWLTSIAFSGLAVICACWAPNVEKRMATDVATTFHNTKVAEKSTNALSTAQLE